MAVHSRHPVEPAPTAPVRESTGHLLLRGYAILVLIVALGTTAFYNLLGTVGFLILLGALTLTSIVLWVLVRPLVGWRRLPWFAVAYTAFALLSTLWSQWPTTSLLTWGLLATTTLQGMFVASVLSWRELVRAISTALKWIVGLSLAFELWVSLVLHHPVLPNFLGWEGDVVPELYWSRNNLIDGGRIQGIVGNAHLLAIACLLALIVFGLRYAARAPRRGWLIPWMLVAAFLLWRSSSGTVWLTIAAVTLVLATAILMRTTTRPGERTKYYVLYGFLGAVLAAGVVFFRDELLSLLGKTSDLTGRQGIWDAVIERAAERPVLGWGFATPWLPWEEHFDGWIVVNDLTVFHAHNMWLDVWFQLGWIGVALLALVYVAVIWRSWFFAVDRPRFDLVSDRPYKAITLLPTLTMTVLLVQGLAESRPLMEWGWMFVVMFGMKIKQAPIVGEGPIEQRLAMERGDLLREPA